MHALRSIFGRIIDRTVKHRVPGSFLAYDLARRIMQSYDNNDVDMRTNGERWLQEKFASQPIVAVDVGANEGEWINSLIERVGDVRAFCFEPVPTTFIELAANVRDPRVTLVNIALSSKEGTLTINSAIDNPYISSIHDVNIYDGKARLQKIQVPAVTLDQQLAVLEISHVDILKVDAEGHDYDVLCGGKNSIRDGVFDVIQFEYNALTLLARRSLRDFFELLEPGYLVGRLLTSGVEACGYHTTLDDFRQSNWVAMRLNLLNEEYVERFSIRPAQGLSGFALRERLRGSPAVGRALGLD